MTLGEVLSISDAATEPQEPNLPTITDDLPSFTEEAAPKSESPPDTPVLYHVPPEWCERVRAMPAKHAPIWSSKAGLMQATEHRIDLKPNTIPVHQGPYRAGPREREF